MTMRRMFSLLLLSAGGLSLLGARCDNKLPVTEEPDGSLLEASVTLLGSTRRIVGMPILPYAHTAAVGSVDQPRPHRLTIRMPDDKSITLTSRNTSLTTLDGIVESSYVRRPMHPVRFQEALADLRRTMEELNIEPDERMKKQMAPWVGDIPGMEGGGIPYAFEAGSLPFGGGSISIKISPLPGSGWYYLMVFQATVDSRYLAHAAKHLSTLPDDGPAVLDERKLPAVSAPLLGPCTRVEGMQLPVMLPDTSKHTSDFLEPNRLTIGLPDGKSLTLTTRAMAMLTNYGIVQDVYARRPPRPVPFQEAVADLHATMKDLGIEPDEAMAARMASWPREAPKVVQGVEPDDYRARTRVSDAVDLEVRLVADPRGGWFTLLMFGVNAEAMKAPQAAAARLAAEHDDAGRAANRPAVPFDRERP